jgi:ParB family chromosome partitioning protein
MSEIVAVSPFRCRMWSEHGRLEEHLSEENCKAEIESFELHGQLLPALGRRVRSVNGCDIELIYGARRLFVARHLNVELRVELRELSDREAIVMLDAENRLRRDFSPYERGCSFQSWLRSGHFESQRDIATALAMSPAQVSRLMKIARLPAVLINAFTNPNEICELWGVDLFEAWQDESSRAGLIERARDIARLSPRLAADRVIEELLVRSIRGGRAALATRDEVVRGQDGKPLFRVRYGRTCLTVSLPLEGMTSSSLTQIKAVLSKCLQSEDCAPTEVTSSALPSRSRRLTHNFRMNA